MKIDRKLVEQFKWFDLGVDDVAEGWGAEEWHLYREWSHVHEYDADDYCVVCGLDGRA